MCLFFPLFVVFLSMLVSNTHSSFQWNIKTNKLHCKTSFLMQLDEGINLGRWRKNFEVHDTHVPACPPPSLPPPRHLSSLTAASSQRELQREEDRHRPLPLTTSDTSQPVTSRSSSTFSSAQLRPSQPRTNLPPFRTSQHVVLRLNAARLSQCGSVESNNTRLFL